MPLNPACYFSRQMLETEIGNSILMTYSRHGDDDPQESAANATVEG